jgi:hypothetical protein
MEKPSCEFSKRGDRKSGLQSLCKDCDHNRKFPTTKRRIKTICREGFKTCSFCKKEKPLTEFSKRSGEKFEFQSCCRECNNKKNFDTIHEKSICNTCGNPTNKGNSTCYECAIKKRDGDPEHIKKVIEANRKIRSDPKYLKNHREAVNKNSQNLTWRENQLKSSTGEGFWYGHRSINRDLILEEDIRHSSKYKEWRTKVFSRDGYKDWFCGLRETLKNPINAHHIKPFWKILNENGITSLSESERCEELWDINNGVTMLRKTHFAYHTMWNILIP